MPDDFRPFNPDEYVPGARITSNSTPGGRAPLIAELKKHVLGQRVTNIEVTVS